MNNKFLTISVVIILIVGFMFAFSAYEKNKAEKVSAPVPADPAHEEPSPTARTTTGIGGSVTIGQITVSPKRLVEDSRCPKSVQCIQAGRVVIEADVTGPGVKQTILLASDKATTLGRYIISLVTIAPEKLDSKTIPDSDYAFTISVGEDFKG